MSRPQCCSAPPQSWVFGTLVQDSQRNRTCMSLPAHLRSLVKRVCQHEAGHYVIARSLGFHTGDLSIELLDTSGGHLGSSEVIMASTLTTTAEVLTFARNRVLVLYAGVLSEAMNQGEIDNDAALMFIRDGGAMDHAKVRELVHLIRGIEHSVPETDDEHQKQLDEIDLALWNAAADAVLRERACIEAVSSSLATKTQSIRTCYSLREDELRSIPELERRFGGIDAAVKLSSPAPQRIVAADGAARISDPAA